MIAETKLIYVQAQQLIGDFELVVIKDFISFLLRLEKKVHITGKF